MSDAIEAQRAALELTTEAATSLYRRNLARRATLDASQRYLLGSAFFAGLAISCYAFTQAIRAE